jgi:hypothetical protein
MTLPRNADGAAGFVVGSASFFGCAVALACNPASIVNANINVRFLIARHRLLHPNTTTSR